MSSQPVMFENPYRKVKDTFKELHRSMGILLRVSDIVQLALDSNYIPEEVKDRAMFNGLAEMCREALKEKDENGLPYAKPIGRGKDARWQRWLAFNQAETIQLLHDEFEAIGGDIKEFRKLHESARDRFGDAIPDFKF